MVLQVTRWFHETPAAPAQKLKNSEAATMHDHKSTAIDYVCGGCSIGLGLRGHTAAHIIGHPESTEEGGVPTKAKTREIIFELHKSAALKRMNLFSK